MNYWGGCEFSPSSWFGTSLATSSRPITIPNQLSRSVITRYSRSSAVPARYGKYTGIACRFSAFQPSP
jgi:hypothetical protein